MKCTVVLTCVVLLTAVSTAMSKYLALPAGSFGSTPYHRSLQFEKLEEDPCDNPVEEGDSDSTWITAFVCDPGTFTKTTALLEIGGILYVCVTPKSTQPTTVIEDVGVIENVINFRLTKDGKTTNFDLSSSNKEGFDFENKEVFDFDLAVSTVTSSVATIEGLNTRQIIIATPVPAIFFDAGGDITAEGALVITQKDLLHDTSDFPVRGLQADANNVFRLNIKVDKYAGSSGASGLNSLKMSTIFFIVGALSCLL